MPASSRPSRRWSQQRPCRTWATLQGVGPANSARAFRGPFAWPCCFQTSLGRIFYLEDLFFFYTVGKRNILRQHHVCLCWEDGLRGRGSAGRNSSYVDMGQRWDRTVGGMRLQRQPHAWGGGRTEFLLSWTSVRLLLRQCGVALHVGWYDLVVFEAFGGSSSTAAYQIIAVNIFYLHAHSLHVNMEVGGGCLFAAAAGAAALQDRVSSFVESLWVRGVGILDWKTNGLTNRRLSTPQPPCYAQYLLFKTNPGHGGLDLGIGTGRPVGTSSFWWTEKQMNRRYITIV